MAIDSEAKRWGMLGVATGPVRAFVFNPDTSGLAAIERATVLKIYAGNALDDPTPVIVPIDTRWRIGSATGTDRFKRIGSATATDQLKRIGSSSA